MSMPMQKCQFPGCDHEFPEHYLIRYCGAHPKHDILVLVVAGQAHEDWRNEWKRQNGDKPRIKKTSDTMWVAAHGGATELDIAATAYADLPADWQKENKLGAEVVADEVLAAIAASRTLDDAFIEDASAIVHAKWVERNGSWAAEELKKPYADLPEGEKEKDRIFVRRAVEAYRQLG